MKTINDIVTELQSTIVDLQAIPPSPTATVSSITINFSDGTTQEFVPKT